MMVSIVGRGVNIPPPPMGVVDNLSGRTDGGEDLRRNTGLSGSRRTGVERIPAAAASAPVPASSTSTTEFGAGGNHGVLCKSSTADGGQQSRIGNSLAKSSFYNDVLQNFQMSSSNRKRKLSSSSSSSSTSNFSSSSRLWMPLLMVGNAEIQILNVPHNSSKEELRDIIERAGDVADCQYSFQIMRRRRLLPTEFSTSNYHSVADLRKSSQERIIIVLDEEDSESEEEQAGDDDVVALQ
eukprot:TRINITY_DN1089_c0_g1_i2.p1 TRINITY_DN1089_c0_g1~~TRINITY_DN1089_c0_g1_i2.p1  ORF type:complete len:239 (-),score=63.41 TRINITY_DN1089_c0_g1_i2:46-762(-)